MGFFSIKNAEHPHGQMGILIPSLTCFTTTNSTWTTDLNVEGKTVRVPEDIFIRNVNSLPWNEQKFLNRI